MGGYSGGEVASNLAVLTVKKYIEEKIGNKKQSNAAVTSSVVSSIVKNNK